MSRESSLPFTAANLGLSKDDRLPVWACASTILSLSALSYWLLFELIRAIFR